KIYRRACWEAIGGLVPMTGWDTIDEMKANMLGWQTRPFRDLVTIQHRVTGGADGSWKNSVKNGRANFNTGYHPLFMFLKCLKRIPRRPVLLDAAGLARGYFGSWLAGASPVHDPALVAFVRNQQIRRLTFRPSIYDR
ncbi:MAG TPA: glycosyltransferase family 2 protein, partial [Kiritimatiellia bacterium]